MRGKENVWEVDIRIQLPEGTTIRERRNAPVSGKSNAQRWARDRELILVRDGKPNRSDQPKEVCPTITQFADRFLDGYARANRHKPSGVAAKESIIRCHLVPHLGDQPLDGITTEAVQRLKMALRSRSAKTINNVLTVLNVMLRTAVEWGVLREQPCAIRLVRTERTRASFYGFDDYERVVSEAGREGVNGHLVALLGGEAGLRCGEMMALEWADVDVDGRQLCVARSEWKGHVTDPKGGRPRYVRLTTRLSAALREARHTRSPRVLCDRSGASLTQKEIQGLMRRIAERAGVKPGVHILRHTFCSRLAMKGAPAKAIQELAGHQDLSTTQRYMHLSPAVREGAIDLLEPADPLAVRGAQREAAGIGGENARTS